MVTGQTFAMHSPSSRRPMFVTKAGNGRPMFVKEAPPKYSCYIEQTSPIQYLEYNGAVVGPIPSAGATTSQIIFTWWQKDEDLLTRHFWAELGFDIYYSSSNWRFGVTTTDGHFQRGYFPGGAYTDPWRHFMLAITPDADTDAGLGSDGNNRMRLYVNGVYNTRRLYTGNSLGAGSYASTTNLAVDATHDYLWTCMGVARPPANLDLTELADLATALYDAGNERYWAAMLVSADPDLQLSAWETWYDGNEPVTGSTRADSIGTKHLDAVLDVAASLSVPSAP